MICVCLHSGPPRGKGPVEIVGTPIRSRGAWLGGRIKVHVFSCGVWPQTILGRTGKRGIFPKHSITEGSRAHEAVWAGRDEPKVGPGVLGAGAGARRVGVGLKRRLLRVYCRTLAEPRRRSC